MQRRTTPTPTRARYRRALATAALAGSASSLWAASSPPADAADVSVLAAGTVTAIADPGGALAVPADGRVNGYRFAGHVLGVATGAADPAAGLAAGPGQQLWVFGLDWAADAVAAGPDATPQVLPVAATVAADGQRLPVPLIQPAPPSTVPTTVAADGIPAAATVDSSREFFAASVPASAADVTVEMACDGYHQTFSLTRMGREGPQPAALYRNPTSWQTVIAVGDQRSLPTPYSYPPDQYSLPDAALHLDLDTVTVSYFGPDGATDPAAGPGQAWLTPGLSDPFNPDNADATQTLEYLTPTTAADLALTVTNPTPPPATTTAAISPKALPGGPDTPGGNGNNDLFNNLYTFAVPADVAAANLTVSPPPEAVTPAYSGNPNLTVHPAAVTYQLAIPAAAVPPARAGAATAPARLTTARTATKTAQKNSSNGSAGKGGSVGSGALAAAAVIAAVVIAGAAAWGITRRRRTTLAAAGDGTVGPAFDPSPGGPRPPPPSTAGATTNSGSARSNGQPTPAEPTPAGPSPAGPSPAGPCLAGPFRAPDPPVLAEPAVCILGTIEVTGWAEKPNRNAITHIVVYLAAHPAETVSREKLLQVVGLEGDDERARATLRTYMSRTRRCLGHHHLPDSTGDGYQLHDVTTDWDTFQTLTATARQTARAGDPAAAIAAYSQALALVRGAPFSQAGAEYGWVDLEDRRHRIEAAISRAAHELVDLAVAAGRPDLGVWAAHQGLLACEYDQTLDAAALRAAAATGRPGAQDAERARIDRHRQSLQRRDQLPPED